MFYARFLTLLPDILTVLPELLELPDDHHHCEAGVPTARDSALEYLHDLSARERSGAQARVGHCRGRFTERRVLSRRKLDNEFELTERRVLSRYRVVAAHHPRKRVPGGVFDLEDSGPAARVRAHHDGPEDSGFCDDDQDQPRSRFGTTIKCESRIPERLIVLSG